MSNSTQNETHNVCNERLAREGGKATCCDCDPHEGCTLGMKPTQNDWEEWSSFISPIVGKDGCIQMTPRGVYDWWKIKLADARREVIGKVEKIGRYKTKAGTYSEAELDKSLAIEFGYNRALDDVLATLKEEIL